MSKTPPILATFAVCLVIAFAALRTAHSASENEILGKRRHEDILRKHGQEARRNEEFLIVPSDASRADHPARDLKEVARNSFTGFEETLFNDAGFRKSYFSTVFGTQIHWPTSSSLPEDEEWISISWIGCLDILKRHGADLLFVGNSEAAESLVPTVIAGQFAPAKPKILFCITGGLPLNVAEAFADALAKTGAKPRRIVWGFSPWTLHESGHFLNAAAQGLLDEIAGTETQKHTSFLETKFASFFPPLSWGDVLPVGFQALRKYRIDKNSPSLARKDYGCDHCIDTYANTTTKALSVLDDVNPSECANVGEKETLLRALKKFKSIAAGVSIFAMPETRFTYAGAPDCYRSAAISRMERDAKEAGATFSSLSFKDYGLTLSDFMHAAGDGRFEFDPNHPNYAGALKISSRVGKWLKETGAK